MGMRPGAADIMFIIDRLFHALELKTEKGTQIPTQKSFEADVVRAGGTYHIAYGYDEAIAVLQDMDAFKPNIVLTRRGIRVLT